MSRRKNKPRITSAVFRLGAAAALGYAARGRLSGADEKARREICDRRDETMDLAMPVVTDLGSVYALGGAAAVLASSGRRASARRLAAAGGLAWVMAQGMKPAYKRPRPYEDGSAERLVRTPAGSSYPSGHPAVAAAMVRVLENETVEPGRSLLRKVPALVAFSRVYNGVHHPTDVIGGLLIGRACGDIVRKFSGGK